MDIKAIIFDMDGTLVESMESWDNAGSDYLLSIGVTPKPNLNEELRTMSMKDAGSFLISEYNLSFTPEEIYKSISNMMKEFYVNKVELKSGVLPFLEEMKNRNVKMCVATATPKLLAIKALERCNILSYFDNVFSCEEVGKSKNYPEIFNLAYSTFDFPHENICVFEDAPYAAKTAKSLGFKVVGLYDFYYREIQDELKSYSDIYVNTFKELSGLI